MLCGELVNGGLASAGALPVPYGLWLPGSIRAASPNSTKSIYVRFIAEIIIEKYLEEQRLSVLSDCFHQMELDNSKLDYIEKQEHSEKEIVLLGKSIKQNKYLCFFFVYFIFLVFIFIKFLFE